MTMAKANGWWRLWWVSSSTAPNEHGNSQGERAQTRKMCSDAIPSDENY